MDGHRDSSSDAKARRWWEDLSGDGLSRRRFLSLVSASAAFAVGSSSCSRADRGHVVPYTQRPPEILPGVATYYASTFAEGIAAHGVLVKTREGRPIHVEGNEDHPGSALEGEARAPGAAAPLRAIADILGLYDPERLRRHLIAGRAAEWPAAIERVAKALEDCAAKGKTVLFLAGASLSPTRRALLGELAKRVPSLRVLAWEPAASDSEIVAAERAFGAWRPTALRLERAEVVLALEADFLGADPAAARNARAFAARRRPGGPLGPLPRLWALEGSLSLTGANADERIPARPSALAAAAFALARALSEEFGISLPAGFPREALAGFGLEEVAARLGPGDAPRTARRLRALAADLKRAGPRAVVIPGPALPPEAHVAVHLLHAMLGAEGNTLGASLAPEAIELATWAEVRAAFEEASRGSFGAAIFWGVNPAYCLDPALWEAAIAKIPFRARISLTEDETAAACDVVLAENHWLESWGDHEVRADLLSLQQPASSPLGEARQGEEAILAILRRLGADLPEDYSAFLRARWEKEVYPLAVGGLGHSDGGPKPVSFEAFWNAALHDGFFRRRAAPAPPRALRVEAAAEAAESALEDLRAGGEKDFELVLSPSSAVYDGRYAGNGWLEELPDPVTKATWGNPLALSAADAKALGVSDGDVLRVEAGAASIEVPAIVQPGQAPRVAALALGYGRRSGAVARGIGANAFALADASSPAPFLRLGVRISRTGGRARLARTQEHHRMEGRDLARAWSLREYAERSRLQVSGGDRGALATLYPELRFLAEKWGMAIDLGACTGCSACVVACQSENNVLAVGPEGVERSREMHWIRIDRYYEGDVASPRTHHLPVLCQHCDHAPCETVCPVNATTHSPDGLNQMTYNRCIGTRYCANNCPYKVRRFNFFEYAGAKREPEALALNPEVTVRPRGVMEKCTFCVQRIQDARMRAKAEGRRVRDGEIRPACAAACPGRAIVFGDLNDPESEVAKLSRSDRGYQLLEELGVRPAVTYLARVVNPVAEEGSR